MASYGFGPLTALAVDERPAVQADLHGKPTWFQNASGPGKNDGTKLDASWLNHMAANLSYTCSMAALLNTNDQGDDTYLYRAIVGIARAQANNVVSNYKTPAQLISVQPFGSVVSTNVQTALADVWAIANQALATANSNTETIEQATAL